MYPWLLMAGGPPQGSQAQPNLLVSMFPIIMIFAFFYLLILMPKQKEQKKHAEMLKNLKRGDRVLTTGGMLGNVMGVKESIVVLRIAEGVKAEFQLSSIQAVIEGGKEE